MIKRLIIFLIRKRLGLKKFERFQFVNQASKRNDYHFTSDALIKVGYYRHNGEQTMYIRPSHVSFNFLLSDDCQIKKRGSNEQ